METGTPAINRRLPVTSASTTPHLMPSRVRVAGKFLYAGNERVVVKGVTYGPFRPGPDGCEYHDPHTVERDFEQMAASGLTTVRTYTVPPTWLLDIAQSKGLRVFVGIPWEQHATFLDDRKTRKRIVETVRSGVRSCAGHAAILAFSIGNEIPAPIVRWHGPRRVESFLAKLARVVRREDPGALVTYVSYPTTEYLDLPFLDFVSFNVFLEDEEQLAAYLARLQNLAGERPLVMAEVGLDSLRNGHEKQSETLAWQIRRTFASGCAGTFVFSWTDEWHRGGHDILDWNFGLTTRDRQPKRALEAVRRAFAEMHVHPQGTWPKISVVVCTYNGQRTIRECLDGIRLLDYSHGDASWECIVVNDGSTDGTADILADYPWIRLVDAGENGGLSRARNLGMRAARGEIVAYIDDDAYPDPAWLTHLALAFGLTEHVGIGGPNIAPGGDGFVADCVAHSPGGPSHVLHSDTEAEHLPGCNMAFRREALLAIQGFDEQFRIAGDDVDLCWRLVENGGTLGFSPGAMVWHHRRGDVKGYLRQQRNYGKAEGMLESKWPEKYNRLGHMRWSGQLYGKGHTYALSLRQRIDYGVWGTRLFQAMYTTGASTFWSLTLMPEWYLVTIALAGLSLLGLFWSPLLWAVPLLVLSAGIPILQACLSAARAEYAVPTAGGPSSWGRFNRYLLTAGLHICQPVARLFGRFRQKLTPWRLHGAKGFCLPYPRAVAHWSEEWKAQADWIHSLERRMQSYRLLMRRGGEFDRWELQADSGLLGGVRVRTTVEEHGAGKQLIRVRVWPRPSRIMIALGLLFGALTIAASIDGAWFATGVLAVCTTMIVARAVRECGAATFSVRRAVKLWQKGIPSIRTSKRTLELLTSNDPEPERTRARIEPAGQDT